MCWRNMAVQIAEHSLSFCASEIRDKLSFCYQYVTSKIIKTFQFRFLDFPQAVKAMKVRYEMIV